MKNCGECHLLRHGDVAGVSALKGEFKSDPTGKTGGGQKGRMLTNQSGTNRGK